MLRQIWQQSRWLAGALLAFLVLSGSCALRTLGVNGLAPQLVAVQPAEEGQSQADPEREAEEARRALELFLRREKLLLRQGEFSLEFNAVYATDTRDAFVPLNDARPLRSIHNMDVLDSGGRWSSTDGIAVNGWCAHLWRFSPYSAPAPCTWWG